MQLSDIITSVQNLLQDNQFSSAQIIEAANWVQYQLFNDVDNRLMQESALILANAGDTTAPYPSDIKGYTSIYLTSPSVINMEEIEMSYKDFIRRYPGWQTATPTDLKNYTDFGSGLRFSAPLSTGITIALDYIRNPVPMAQPSDACEIPDEYREITSRGTLARCMEQNEDYAEAQTERANIAPLIATFNRRYGLGSLSRKPQVINSNRRQFGEDRWR